MEDKDDQTVPLKLRRRYVFGLSENPSREQIKAEIKRLLALLLVLVLLGGCAAFEFSRGGDGSLEIMSRREFQQGFEVSGNLDTGDFEFNTCGGAVTTGRGPLEQAAADVVRSAGQIALGSVAPTRDQIKAAIQADPSLCE